MHLDFNTTELNQLSDSIFSGGFNRNYKIEPGEKKQIGDPGGLGRYADNGFYCFFVFSTDTLIKYNWDVVITENKILEKRIVPKSDITTKNNSITFQ
jgi:hypothetical protein